MRQTVMLAVWAAAGSIGAGAVRGAEETEPGPLVRALWLVQRYGTPEALDPRHDSKVKAAIAKALGKQRVLTPAGLAGLVEPAVASKLAGSDKALDPKEVRMIVDAEAPASRQRLLPQVAAHAAYLTTSLDRIDEPHRVAGDALVDWIARDYRPGRPLHVIVICTGNSRRSILGATMGNVAAAYYGMPEVRFHSGGTVPSAFNPRTVKTLREIGIEIEPDGREAARGEPATANPVYRVRWGVPGGPEAPALETFEFSKVYSDPSNPQSGFAALMVCGEADASCPFVKGASRRISMPYLDPKIYDDGAYEPLKYAERRDDLGRLFLSVMMRVRNRLDGNLRSAAREERSQ